MRTPNDLAMPFLLLDAFETLVDVVHTRLADEGFPGLRAHHGFAMQAIGDGCTSVQLGERLGVSKQAAAKTAQALADLGLVERRTNSKDRRERTIVITDRGHAMLRASATAFRSEIRSWRAELGDMVVDTMLSGLAGVTSHRPGRPRGTFLPERD